MARNFSAAILGIMAGAGVSIASGALLGSYVVSGVTPAYADTAPPRIRPAKAVADEENWPVQDYFAPISTVGNSDSDLPATDPDDTDQLAGVRASGSSRL